MRLRVSTCTARSMSIEGFRLGLGSKASRPPRVSLEDKFGRSCYISTSRCQSPIGVLLTRAWDDLEKRQRPSASYFSRSSHRSEEHTSELQSLMRISYAVFCLKKKK